MQGWRAFNRARLMALFFDIHRTYPNSQAYMEIASYFT